MAMFSLQRWTLGHMNLDGREDKYPGGQLWTFFLPAMLFAVPIMPLLSFRANAWFPALILFFYAVALGPIALSTATSNAVRQAAFFAPYLIASAISCIASETPLIGATSIVGAAASIAIGASLVGVALVIPPSYVRRCCVAFLAGVTVGLLFFILLNWRVITLWSIHGPAGENLFGYTRGIITLLILLPSAISIAGLYFLKDSDLFLMFALAALAALAVYFSESESSKVVLPVGYFVLTAARFLPRQMFFATGIVGAVGLLLWPILIKRFAGFVAQSGASIPDFGSASTRLKIWEISADAVWQSPWIGYGIDAVRYVPQLAERVRFIHPHSVLAQVWVDLGLLGVLALLIIFVASLRLAWRLAPCARAAALSTVVISGALWTMTFGIWQSWFLGTLGFAAFVIALLNRFEHQVIQISSLNPKPSDVVECSTASTRCANSHS